MDETHKQISESRAYSRMSNICARKECCAFDIETKLLRYNLEPEIIKRIIDQLKKERFIDELRFTKSFIHDKVQFNKWGKVKIEFALRQKKIPQDITAEAFSEFPAEKLNDSLPDLLHAKWRTIKGNSEYEKQNKLIRFALGRGFDMNNILKCMKNLK